MSHEPSDEARRGPPPVSRVDRARSAGRTRDKGDRRLAPASRTRRAKSGSDDGVKRDAWLAAARAMLIRKGAAGVRVERLAEALKVTRGGFYYRFRDREDLMDTLLADWRETNSASLLAALAGPGTPIDRMRALMETWISEAAYDPAYDIAMRSWAVTSKKVARVVSGVDQQRIEAVQAVFNDAGLSEEEAFIRARVLYYHQVGYYAMGVKEPKAKRRAVLDLYARVLTGFE